MNKIFSLSILFGAVLVLAGCQPPSGSASSSATSGVAIIDLDRVATTMGWIEDISKNLQAADSQLRGQLANILNTSRQAIEDEKRTLIADAKLTPEQTNALNTAKSSRDLEALPLTKEQREKLGDAVNKANTTWQNALQQYQQALQGQKAQLILSYRDKIKPAARRIASTRGLTVVLTTADNVLYYDPKTADITDAVIDELQKTMPKSAPAASLPSPVPPVPPPAAPVAPAPATPAK